ncbi:MAG: hypothetical protein AABY22_23195, partial [Nanoarchaeota archaeon]
MSKYFFDTEFLEGKQDKRILGFKYGETEPTIDLISIGIVTESSREYYAISKEFNLEEAWNRYDEKYKEGGLASDPHTKYKDYWIRENVLKSVFQELKQYELDQYQTQIRIIGHGLYKNLDFNYQNFKKLINKYGKTNKQIAAEIIDFCRPISKKAKAMGVDFVIEPVDFPEFYAYYGAYDWVVFCWIFGKMINRPKGFPMFVNDLKQMQNDLARRRMVGNQTFEDQLRTLKEFGPKQINAHNA